ncbi:MAG: hypothetical protein HC822_02415 [Oscillochloris sp.]|nr:hypothetical protein [Oscillochloris sp.]
MALIALPCQGKPVTPPLTLAYIATLLEQRRHIVRIYDLALQPQVALEAAFQPLHSFKPNVVVVAGEHETQIREAVDVLQQNRRCATLPVQMSRSGIDANYVAADVMAWIDRQQHSEFATILQTIDQLPHPARHLLSLESYDPRAVGGELQTPIVIAGVDAQSSKVVFRAPSQIIAELRAVSQEFGLRHYHFGEIPVTLDRAWLSELATRISDARLGIGWEAIANADDLDDTLIASIAQSGCESLNFHLDAARVFESTSARSTLVHVFATARNCGIFVRAHVKLEPPYESVPALVDVAATFGLDDVRFDVAPSEAVSVGADGVQLQAMARQIYDAGRDRQRFIDRFGPALGNLLWKLRGPRSSPAPNLDKDDGLPVA